MQSMRRIGLATGTLTDDEINYLEKAITKTVRPMLIGRQLMPIISLAHAGFRKYTYYTENDMGQAIIDMQGEEQSQDLVDLDEEHVKLPILHKEYTLHWRDVLMRREGGQDLNSQHAENAARQVAEEEDKLILTGEVAGTLAWPALDIEGLCTATGNQGAAGGAWPTNVVANVATAKQALRAQGFYGPYRLIVPSVIYGYMEGLIGTTDKWYFQAVGELIGGVENILVSDNLIASDGNARDSALLVDVQPGNFNLVVGADITNHLAQKPDMNYFGRVWEAVVPVVKRPLAIYEIQTITSG
jgi:uncharacterized linocin/CFP29 family protein